MSLFSRGIAVALCLLTLIGSLSQPVQSQGPPVRPRPGSTPGGAGRSPGKTPETQISVDLLTGEEGVGLPAQRWSELFNSMHVTLQIRRAAFDDKPSLTEQSLAGGARKVRLVGTMDRTGKLTFPNRKFTTSDSEKLEQWIKDLRTFGAQGTPDGRPLWGLSKAQFVAIHEALNPPVTVDYEGKSFVEAVAACELPDQYKVAYGPTATRLLEGSSRKARQSLKGVSKGTAFAVLLSEQGFCFKPTRTPSGSIELNVVPLKGAAEVWPIGWPLPKRGVALAPKLYAMTKIELQDIELDAVLAAAADVTSVPILIDYGDLDARKIDLSKVKVSLHAKQTTWSAGLKALTFSAPAKPELWVDEAGKPFIWVTPIAMKSVKTE